MTAWTHQRHPQAPPKWLELAMEEMQKKYSSDKFEITIRKVASSQYPEWRVKCLDCPGKVSTLLRSTWALRLTLMI